MMHRASCSSLALTCALIGSLAAHRAIGQCPDNNTQVGATITPTCPGTYSPAPCVLGSEYVRVNVTAGNTYTFSTCGENDYNTTITLYTTGSTFIANSYDACGTQSSVTWTAPWTGQVKVLLDRGGNCRSSSICTPVTITCTNTAPTNDLICNATTLPVGSGCTNITPAPTNALATNTAGPPAPGCASYSGGDVWFKLTVPAGGRVTVTTSTITSSAFVDGGLAVYSSSDNTCTGTLTLLGCNDDLNAPYNMMSSLDLTGLTVGNTLFIRVWENGNDAIGQFNICAEILAALPNEPCTSEAITVGSSCTYANFTNVGATRTTSVGNPGCGNFTTSGGAGSQSKDVWFSFVAPPNGRIVIQSNTGSLTDGAMALYSSSNGTCSGTFTLITCDDDGGSGFMPLIVQTGLTPGTTYWLRFWGYGNATGTFQLCIFSPTGIRPEDCLGGYTLCDDQQVSNNSQYTGFVSDLTVTNQGCLASSEKQGTWYIFSMASGGNLGFTIDPTANDDYDWAIWGPYSTGSTTGSVCIPTTAPIRCSYASGANTFSATGSYNTGMGHATYTPPQWAAPAVCGTCTQGSGGNGWVSGMSVTTGQTFMLYVSNFSQSGSAFDLTWNLQSGASLACTILPVELMSLTAQEQSAGVNVTWTTLTEHHSDYFVVERSADARIFQPIGTVEAAGESQQRVDYVFFDPAPLQGANYYRLKQVDQDGAFEHTPAVVVLFGNVMPDPQVFPNPVAETLQVAFDMPATGTTYVQVLDMMGRVLRDRDMDLNKGPQTISLPVRDLPPGSYSLRIWTTATGGHRAVRFTKE